MLYPSLCGRHSILTALALLFLAGCRLSALTLHPTGTHAQVAESSAAEKLPVIDGAAVAIESQSPRDHSRDLVPLTDRAAIDIDNIPELIKPQAVPHDGVTRMPVVNKNTRVVAYDGVGAELYTVVADQVPVAEILHSISRDADVQVSFIGDIAGDISLSMINQPLSFILDQIATQADVRYELHGEQILLLEDKPVVRTYELDYLNMQRVLESRVDLATQVGSISTSVESNNGAQAGGNGSRLFVENKSTNTLWQSVANSISGVLGEVADEGNGSENVFINKEAGLISVRAREAQHQLIEKFLRDISRSAQRQVLIEATVVEVTLNDKFESGVDWQVLNRNGAGFDYSQVLAGVPQASSATAPVTALLSYSNPASVLGNLTATLKLLQQFGEVQVLSSPKIIALNNQPAILKVVDNRIYFTFEVDRMERENGDERTVVDSTVHSVPVGLVMSVTPFVSKDHEVILNVRPTISRILNFAEDPSPALAGQNQVRNLIPEIQVREMESLLRVQSGKVAIIGGLMQNKVDNRRSGVPGLQNLPLLGALFTHKRKSIEKTELLVFLRPTVIGEDIQPTRG